MKQNMMFWIKLPMMNQFVYVCVCNEFLLQKIRYCIFLTITWQVYSFLYKFAAHLKPSGAPIVLRCPMPQSGLIDFFNTFNANF
jgi:hypothetical protein